MPDESLRGLDSGVNTDPVRDHSPGNAQCRDAVGRGFNPSGRAGAPGPALEFGVAIVALRVKKMQYTYERAGFDTDRFHEVIHSSFNHRPVIPQCRQNHQ